MPKAEAGPPRMAATKSESDRMLQKWLARMAELHRCWCAYTYFDAESFSSSAIASCTVVMNRAEKKMVEFFSTEISAIVLMVRS
jgi:hypothetical protein